MRVLEIETKDFLEWFFYSGSDQEQEELAKNLGYSVIGALIQDGSCMIGSKEFLHVCESDIIPMKIIKGFENVEGCIEDHFEPSDLFEIKLV